MLELVNALLLPLPEMWGSPPVEGRLIEAADEAMASTGVTADVVLAAVAPEFMLVDALTVFAGTDNSM